MVRDAAAALLLLCAVSAVTVPPPTNLSVSCHNLKTTVNWAHSEESQTRFLVHVLGSDRSEAKSYETESSARELDLTRFVWESAESCMDYYYVTVTAVLGRNQSASVESKSFSFNRLKTPHVPCFLDFPPVELTVGESEATVGFQNPLSFYKELDQVARQDADVYFDYSVTTQNKTFGGPCSREDVACRRVVRFPEGAEPCVTLEGRLCNRDCLGEVAFRKTERICADNRPKVLAVTLTLMLGVLLFVVVVVTVCICKVRGWTMDKKDPQTPRALMFGDEEKQATFFPSTHGTVEQALFVTALTPDCSVTQTDDCEDDDGHRCRDASICSEGGYRDGGLSEDSNQGSGCGSEATESVSLDSEDDDAAGGYDRPHRLLDMGGGDMVTSYSR